MVFGTGAGEQMRLTDTGLGIGTSSPGFQLDVRRSSNANVANFQQTGAGLNTDIYVNNVGSANNFLISRRSNGESWLYNSGADPFVFSTSATERARITSGGDLLVGTTSSSDYRMRVDAPANNHAGVFVGPTAGYASLQVVNTAASGTRNLISFRTAVGGSQVGAITTDGTNTTYSTSSDYRLKNTIAPMTGALAKIAALKPCTYKWNADGSDGQGFIAHELAEVVPQCVTGEKDAVDAEGNPQYQGIDTSFLVATLTAAIQELKAEFDAYKATHP